MIPVVFIRNGVVPSVTQAVRTVKRGPICYVDGNGVFIQIPTCTKWNIDHYNFNGIKSVKKITQKVYKV